MQYPSFGDNGPSNFKDIFNALLNNGKDAIDNAMAQYSENDLTNLVQDLYDRLSNPSTGGAAFGGNLPGGFDADKLAQLIDKAKDQLQNPVVSLMVAKQIKGVLKGKTNEEIQALLEESFKGRSMNDQMMLQMALYQLGPVLDDLRNATDEDVAAKIRDAAANLPSDQIAQQLVDMLQQNAPQAPSTEDLTKNLPAAEDVAGTVHKLGEAASKALDDAAKSSDMGQAADILKKFSDNARTIIQSGFGGGGKGPKGPGRRFDI